MAEYFTMGDGQTVVAAVEKRQHCGITAAKISSSSATGTSGSSGYYYVTCENYLSTTASRVKMTFVARLGDKICQHVKGDAHNVLYRLIHNHKQHN